MAVVPSIAFGTLLRRWRKAAGLTQEELAERAGLSVRGISDLERGLKHRPHRDTVQLLADALQLTEQDRSTFEAAGRRLGSGSRFPADSIQPLESERPFTDAEPSTQVQIFLIADVRGYTRFTQEHGDEAAAKLAAQFAAIAREVAASHDGQVIELRGDEALAVFSSARQALRAAADLQGRLATETIVDTTLPLKVGIGLDVGEAISVEGGYRGAALNLAARLCSLAGPGEVLASEGVVHLARKLEGLEYAERGAVQLKGFVDAVRVVQVVGEQAQGQPGSIHETDTGGERPAPIGGFLGALPAGPLVARDAELTKVLSVVDAVASGSGRLVFLVGEPGIGKTRLAQEVTLQLRNRSFVVASGRCYEPQEAVPFYPFLEALGTLYTSAPASIRADAERRWPHLFRLLPNVSLPAPTSSGEGREEQERLFWAVTGFLQAIAEEVPVALLLDDLHWADSTSLALLQHLARHTRAYRVLLLGTYRDEEVGRQHPLERGLRDLNREQLAERVPIRRLGQGGIAALIAMSLGGDEISPELSELVYRHTEGNPFFTQEVLRALMERGDIYRVHGGWERREIGTIEVPESIRSAIGERLSRLSEASQEILQEASVLGHTFSFDDLQAMGNRAEEELEAALEEAMVAGLVRETGRDEHNFNHALTQQALYAQISGRRKRKLHLAAGEALTRLPEARRKERAAELVWHFLEGHDTQRALPYALVAGDQAEAVFAHPDAEQRYRTALDLARELADKARESEALGKLGGVLYASGRYDEALDVLERAAEIVHREGDLEAEARVTASIGRVHRARGSQEDGIARLQPMLQTLAPSGPSHALVSLYVALADLFLVTGRYEANLQAAERASDLARSTGDDRLLAAAEKSRGTALLMLGQWEAGLRVLLRVAVMAEAAGVPRTLFDALVDIGYTYQRSGQPELATQYVQRALQVAKQMCSPDLTAFALLNLSGVFAEGGDWKAAREYGRKAAEILQAMGSDSYSATYAPLILGHRALEEGNWEEAAEGFAQALALAEGTGDRQLREGAQLGLAELDILQGRAEAALARLTPLTTTESSNRTSSIHSVLAWALLELEQVNQAAEVVATAVAAARKQQDASSLAEALRVEGMVLTRRGLWEDAMRALDEALDLIKHVPYGRALILYAYGMMHDRKGTPRQARDQLEAALVIFQRLGAKKDVERAEQALAALSYP